MSKHTIREQMLRERLASTDDISMPYASLVPPKSTTSPLVHEPEIDNEQTSKEDPRLTAYVAWQCKHYNLHREHYIKFGYPTVEDYINQTPNKEQRDRAIKERDASFETK